MHEIVDEEETTPFGVGGEPNGGDDVGRTELGSEEELVVELALSLVGGRVHELDGDAFSGGEGAGEDGSEAAVAEAGGEGVGGTAEEGVGEVVRGFVIGWWGGGFFVEGAEVKEKEKEEEREEGNGCGEDWD